MRVLTSILIKWPLLTILVVLAISAGFATQLKYLRIDNDLNGFLPDTLYIRQQINRSWQIFGNEQPAMISISVKEGGPYKDIFNPRVLAIVNELTDWLESLEVEAPGEYKMWVKAEKSDAILKQRSRHPKCTKKQIEEIEQTSAPVNPQDYVKLWVCKAPKTDELEDVVSFVSVPVIYDDQVPATDGSGKIEHMLKIEDLSDEVPQTQAEADRARKLVKSWDWYFDNFVSVPDPKSGLVKSLMIAAYPPSDGRVEYAEKLQTLIEEKIASIQKSNDGLVFRSGGITLLSVWLGKYMQGDLQNLIPFVTLVMLVVLILSFRRVIGVALPLITVSLGTLWAVGFSAFIGKPLTIVTATIPTLITAVGSAYTIHVIHTYFDFRRAGLSKREAIIDAMDKVGIAVWMAGLTTIGGFISLSTSMVLPIRDFGILAAFGAFSCLVVSVTFAPAMLVLLDRKKITTETGKEASSEDELARGLLGKVLTALAGFITRRKTLVGGLALVLMVGCVMAARQVPITGELAMYFLKDSEIRQSDNFFKNTFGGASLFSITIDGQEADYWKDPKALEKIDKLLDHVNKRFSSDIGKTMSINDFVKKMWMVLHNDDPAYFRIPDTRQGVADCLFMYSTESDSLSTLVDFDYRRIRMNFKMRHGDSATLHKIIMSVDKWMAAHYPELRGKPAPPLSVVEWILLNLGIANPKPEVIGAHYHYGGDSFMNYTVNRMTVIGQMRSLSFSLIIVFVLTAFIFRSFVGGLLSVTPIIITVTCNFAIMGLFKIPLDLGTAIVANAAVGIGIDYAIHYINRYRLERNAGRGAAKAVKGAHLTSGKAIVFNAVAVAFGFFVLTLSNFNPIIRMGTLIGLTMLISSFMALTVLPVLLIWLKPRFIRKIADNG